MDFTIVYVILIAVATVYLGVIIALLHEKFNLKATDVSRNIETSKDIINFIKITAKELGFGASEEIDKVSNIVLKTLDYIDTLSNTMYLNDKILKASVVAIDMCKQANIEVDENREYIIKKMITMSYILLESQKLNK